MIKKFEIEILITLSFVSIIMAYTFYPLLWDKAFYHLTAICFVLLTRIVWKLTLGKWRLVSLVMYVTAINSLMDEIFFDPRIIDYNEYLTLVITFIIVFSNKKIWGK